VLNGSDTPFITQSDLQPEPGQSPNQVAVDETMIRLNNNQYWLYAVVDPETNDLLHKQLEPTTNNALSGRLFAELREKYDIIDATVLIDRYASLQRACRKHNLDFRYK